MSQARTLAAAAAVQTIDAVTPLQSRREAIFRPGEWILAAYFSYTALLTFHFHLSATRRSIAFAVPVTLWLLAYADSFQARRWTGMVRDWLPAALLLAAYWQIDWFQPVGFLKDLERSWLAWDHMILNGWKLHESLESLGTSIPSLLEISYTLVYVIPPGCIAIFYLCHRRDRIDGFLFTFLLGTLATYALLPHFPSASPCWEFPKQDLPGVMTVWRRLNIWILGFGDIHNSVFPSGHVTTTFSAAFAMMLAMPEKKWLGRGLLIEAMLVTLATVYGRYHYAADCLAALAISLLALGATIALYRFRQFEIVRPSRRFVLPLLVLVFCSIPIARGESTRALQAGIEFEVRLQTDVSTYSSHPGDPIRAVVMASVTAPGTVPADDANTLVLLPRGSILLGGVRKVTSIGRGLIHERAGLELEFTEWLHPDGNRYPLATRLIAVNNSREQTTRQGHIKGILAAGGAPGFLLGMWSRPDSILFARTAAGFAGAAHFIGQKCPLGPLAIAGAVGFRFIAVPWPESEIHLPAGTELTLALTQLPSAAPVEIEVPAEPPPESLVTLAQSQPLRTARPGNTRLADITNVLFLGSRDQLNQAFSAAGWWPAESLNRRSMMRVYRAIAEKRGYPTAPMSTLLLESRPPDLNFQKSFNTVAKRHHIRIWRQPDQYQGRDVWIGAATHDVAMRLREAGETFTHRIDPMIDRERRKVIHDLTFAGCAEQVQLIRRPAAHALAGREITTDGDAAVIALRDCASDSVRYVEDQSHLKRGATGNFMRRLVLEGRYAVIRGNIYYWGYRGVRHLWTRGNETP